jgi:hypothetical protein
LDRINRIPRMLKVASVRPPGKIHVHPSGLTEATYRADLADFLPIIASAVGEAVPAGKTNVLTEWGASEGVMVAPSLRPVTVRMTLRA